MQVTILPLLIWSKLELKSVLWSTNGEMDGFHPSGLRLHIYIRYGTFADTKWRFGQSLLINERFGIAALIFPDFNDSAIKTLVCAAIWQNFKQVVICVRKGKVTGILLSEFHITDCLETSRVFKFTRPIYDSLTQSKGDSLQRYHIS